MINLVIRIIFVRTLQGYLTFCKILRHEASGFTSPPMEGVLRIFITLKNLSPSVEFETANLGSNGKHTNHYTTEATITRKVERLNSK
jgi:hypothetical protein